MKTELFDDQGNSRGFYSSLNRLNNLSGKEWLFWTRSVITRLYPPNCQHKLRSAHGGQKPPDLCRDLINVFTKQDQSVLDPLMGVGSTLLGAALAGRKATGIEVNPRWIEIYKEVCRREGLKVMEIYAGDSSRILETLGGREFDLLLTDVPYWKMDSVPRSKGAFKRVGEAAKAAPVSRLKRFNRLEYPGKEDWLEKMGEIFRKAVPLLKPKAYLTVFIGDMYYENEYHCLSAELSGELKKIKGLVWKANIIWYDVSKKLHLYGYQYSFIPSMIHQNILVFRKES